MHYLQIDAISTSTTNFKSRRVPKNCDARKASSRIRPGESSSRCNVKLEVRLFFKIFILGIDKNEKNKNLTKMKRI